MPADDKKLLKNYYGVAEDWQVLKKIRKFWIVKYTPHFNRSLSPVSANLLFCLACDPSSISREETIVIKVRYRNIGITPSASSSLHG